MAGPSVSMPLLVQTETHMRSNIPFYVIKNSFLDLFSELLETTAKNRLALETSESGLSIDRDNLQHHLATLVLLIVGKYNQSMFNYDLNP